MWHWRYLFLMVLIFLITSCGAPGTSNARAARAGAFSPHTPTTALHPTTGMSGPATVPAIPPASCPITQPPSPAFTPPAPYPPEAPYTNGFWYGTAALWTALPGHSVWAGLPHNPDGYTQKVLWWRQGYSWMDEPTPALTVTGERVDAPAPPLRVSRATNAFADEIKSAMLVGVDFPTLGCWKLTGTYADQQLSVVVWIAP
jgi:hypothetical protein